MLLTLALQKSTGICRLTNTYHIGKIYPNYQEESLPYFILRGYAFFFFLFLLVGRVGS